MKRAFIGMLGAFLVGLSWASATTASGNYLQTNNPAWLNPQQLPELVVGPFEFHPRLQTIDYYDDNVGRNSSDKQGDFINRVSPAISMTGGDRTALRAFLSETPGLELMRFTPTSLAVLPAENWPGNIFVMDYAPAWQFYREQCNYDYFDQQFRCMAVLPFSRMVLGARNELGEQHMTIVQNASYTKVQSQQYEISLAYQPNQNISIDSALCYQDTSYPGATNLMGYQEIRGFVSMNRNLFDRLNVGLLVETGNDLVENDQDQVYFRFGNRWRYSFTEIIAVDGTVGIEYRQFASDVNSLWTPYFKIAAQYHPLVRTTIRLEGGRQVTASLLYNNYVVTSGGSLSWSQDITDRFSLMTKAGYYQSSFTSLQQGEDSLDSSDYYIFRSELKMRVWKYWTVGIFYQLSGSGLAQSAWQMQDNQSGIQMDLRY